MNPTPENPAPENPAPENPAPENPKPENSASVAKKPRERKRLGQPGIAPRTWRDVLIYRVVRGISRLLGVTAFDLRCIGRHHLDFEGAALLLSTHQSTLDPVMIGIMENREMCYLARKTLFNSRLFGALIRALNAIEIDREGGGLAGLKETLKRLKAGHKVLIFPEGTRTSTGYPAELKPGFISLARRGSVPLVPVAVTGAFHALKRGSKLPAYAPLCVYIAAPIPAEVVSGLSDEDLLREVSSRLWACHRGALEHTRRAEQLDYDVAVTSTGRASG